MIPDPCTTVAFTGHRTYCGEAAAALAALHAHTAEEIAEVLPANQPALLAFTLRREGGGNEKTLTPFPLLQRLLPARRLIAQNESPILLPKQGVELVGGISHGIQPTNDASHAGADDIVDGDARLLDGFENAHMSSTFHAAAAQDDADLRAPGSFLLPGLHAEKRHCQANQKDDGF